MTVEEATKLKETSEKQIMQILQDLESNTGLYISEVKNERTCGGLMFTQIIISI